MSSRMRYFLLAFSLALNVSFAGTFLYYRYKPEMSRPAPSRVDLGRMDVAEMDRLYLRTLRETLDLDEEQVRQMSPLVHQVHLDLHEVARELNQAGDQLYREATRPKLDEAALGKVHHRWLELRNRQHEVLLNGLLRMREVLTAEQQERFFSHLKRFFTEGESGR